MRTYSLEPFLQPFLGNLFLGTLLGNMFLGTSLGNCIWNPCLGTFPGNLFLGIVPGNLACNLFLEHLIGNLVLGVAADPKLTYAVGEKRSQASFQEEASKQVSRKSFPSKVKFLGTACKYGSQKRFRSKVPGTVSKQGSKQEQGSQEQVLKQAFPERAGSQAKFPGARVPREPCLRTSS